MCIAKWGAWWNHSSDSHSSDLGLCFTWGGEWLAVECYRGIVHACDCL